MVQNRCSECPKGLLKNVSGVKGPSMWRNMHFTAFWLSYLSQWPRAGCYCNSMRPHRHLDNKLGTVAPRDTPCWCLRAACSGECLSGFNDVSSFKLNASGTSPAWGQKLEGAVFRNSASWQSCLLCGHSANGFLSTFTRWSLTDSQHSCDWVALPSHLSVWQNSL